LISGPIRPDHDPARFLAVDPDVPALGVQQKIKRLRWRVDLGWFARSQPVSSLENRERPDGGPVAFPVDHGGVGLPMKTTRQEGQHQPY
jgi:hypothetical protein